MTEAERDAVKWLDDRGGDAVFDKHGVALAAGETAPVRRSTWNKLRDRGLIEFYGGGPGKGRGRLRLTTSALTSKG